MFERALVTPVADNDDATRTRLLDAAYEQFCRRGIARTSMEDVAREANLSRVTVYRKFETRDALVDEVVLREFRRYFHQFLVDIAQAPTVADRVVVGFVSSLRSISGNPLISELIGAEPGGQGSIVGDGGRNLAAVQEFVAGQLRREQRAGTVSSDLDVDLVAEMMVRISASFLMVPSRTVDLHDDDQVAAVARKFLLPMLEV
ncbi:TetR/AcrR family transcriptional regulator [Rhodococcus sp. HNM0569]|uniref:TetR/AcrR family transcriptional regulator n=1 Tax=Rhodococcus sp. HNM0569 TaxID=2716340 RepID=UPI00197E3E53|nr:TetR/AcrR family transcriptional regulator [Rhodococcus sp. HNM0569]